MFGLRQGTVGGLFEVVAAARVHPLAGTVTAERLPLEPELQRRPPDYHDYHAPDYRWPEAALVT